jgi:hypothetical protein
MFDVIYYSIIFLISFIVGVFGAPSNGLMAHILVAVGCTIVVFLWCSVVWIDGKSCTKEVPIDKQ